MLKDTNGNPLLSVNEIKTQILEVMLATLDNPSNAVEWTIRELLKQPKIMQRAIEEIDTIVGSNRLVQESDLPQLNYVNTCIKEAFRLHPLATFNIPHVSIGDAIMGEHFIPKGSVVLLTTKSSWTWQEP
ncbi:valine N-monooxygenase 1-like [Lycium barbarum]|uniref:valine N-monooxygenase 1-like n=1 Tax=Lycium barbarum TaxID=112863 RepID=UPI00293F3F95|nr:valine N-monooxygenase 1-like [Lycium barbarum]